MIVADFSANLRFLCERQGTISNLCRRIGLNRQQFNKYLSGSHLPSSQNLRLIANFFGRAGSDVAWNQISETGVAPLEIIIAFIFRNLLRGPRVSFFLWDPNAPVVPERFRHERQLGLIFVAHWNACRVNLREAGIAEKRAAAMRAPDRRGVATLRVGGKIKNVSVAARRQNHHVGGETFDRAGQEISCDDAARIAVNDDQVQHLAACMHLDAAGGNLLLERLVRAQEQLLPRLSPRIKSAGNLHAAKRARVEQSSVFARERNALRHALVDDVDADLRQAKYVCFARTEISAFHRVVKKAMNAVAVIPVILRRIDAALGRDTVRPPWQPFNGMRPNLAEMMNGGGQGPAGFPTHPYARSPRDYFMIDTDPQSNPYSYGAGSPQYAPGR